MKAEINCGLELVQVLLYLADRQNKTIQVLDNGFYVSEIDKYFGKYKSHYAVHVTQRLIDERNFIHIKPIKAILSLDNILNDKTHILYEWAVAVSDFISVSQFDSFLSGNADYYNIVIDKIKTFNVEKCINFIRAYFKSDNKSFRLLICPFAGNYGFTLDGISYVVRCMPCDENGNIHISYSNRFIRGVAHEYTHCLVNPIIEKYKDRLDKYKGFFAAHKNMYSAYNVDYAVINEYFAIASTVRYMQLFKEDFIDYDNYCSDIERTKKAFVYLDNFVEFLSEYEKSNLAFAEFYLKILNRIGGLR